jgi:hypothetical protein
VQLLLKHGEYLKAPCASPNTNGRQQWQTGTATNINTAVVEQDISAWLQAVLYCHC